MDDGEQHSGRQHFDGHVEIRCKSVKINDCIFGRLFAVYTMAYSRRYRRSWLRKNESRKKFKQLVLASEKGILPTSHFTNEKQNGSIE